MPFYVKLESKSNTDKQHNLFHRSDFVDALILDAFGNIPSNPTGDTITGMWNQFKSPNK